MVYQGRPSVRGFLPFWTDSSGLHVLSPWPNPSDQVILLARPLRLRRKPIIALAALYITVAAALTHGPERTSAK